MRAHRPEREQEEGSALIIALVLTTVIFVVLAAVASLAQTNLKVTPVFTDRRQLLFAADGGAEYGLQRLSDDDDGTPTLCASAGGTAVIGTVQVNGQSVEVQCTGTTAGVTSTARAAIVLTGYQYANGTSPLLTELFKVTDAGSGDPITVSGNVFNAGEFLLSSTAPALTISGDVTQRNPYCLTDKAQIPLPQISLPSLWTCVTSGTAVPDPNPSFTVPATAAPAPRDVGKCRIFFPGRYTTAPVFDSGSHYYFASGVYYFDNVGEVQLKGRVFGGQAGAGETKQINNSAACADDAAANALVPGAATGTGVQLILGGTSRLRANSNSANRVELFSRRASATAAAEPSIIAPTTSGANWSASNQLEPFITEANQPDVVIHGLVYMPRAKLNLWGLPNKNAKETSIMRGGLVVSSLQLTLDTQARNVVVASGAAAATVRTVILRAAASATSNVVATVVAQLDGQGNVTVLSWRVGENEAGPADTTPPNAEDVQGGTNDADRRMEQNETLVVTYNEMMAPASIHPALTTGGTVSGLTVTVTNASNDRLSVTGANLGSVDLGATSWVSANTTFSGSTLRLGADGRTVTITLGTCAGSCGASGPNNSTLRWTPSAAATDLAGNPASTTTRNETGSNDRDF